MTRTSSDPRTIGISGVTGGIAPQLVTNQVERMNGKSPSFILGFPLSLNIDFDGPPGVLDVLNQHLVVLNCSPVGLDNNSVQGPARFSVNRPSAWCPAGS